MTDEHFLASLALHPDDPVRKLVYADWLDEQGEAIRAEFLRRCVTEPYGEGWSELRAQVGRLWEARVTGRRFGRGWSHFPLVHESWWDLSADLGQIALNSLLGTYAGLRSRVDDVHSYEANLVRSAGRWEDALAALFVPECVPTAVALEPLADWAGELQRVLERWLAPSADAEDRRWHAERAAAAVGDVLRPSEGWRVRFEFTGYYSVDWDDLLLTQGGVGLLLHLGRSD